MPDSAVNPALQVADSADAAGSRRTDGASASPSRPAFAGRPAESDADAKLARAARSAQRLALLSRAPYGAPTLDLFAEDAERATLQALNTDIRQSSLPGFELPEVFMAAVPGEDGSSGAVRAWRNGALSVEGAAVSSAAVSSDDAAAQTDSQTADAATLELVFDDVPAPHDVVAGPVQPEPSGDAAQGFRSWRRWVRGTRRVRTNARPRHAPEALPGMCRRPDRRQPLPCQKSGR